MLLADTEAVVPRPLAHRTRAGMGPRAAAMLACLLLLHSWVRASAAFSCATTSPYTTVSFSERDMHIRVVRCLPPAEARSLLHKELAAHQRDCTLYFKDPVHRHLGTVIVKGPERSTPCPDAECARTCLKLLELLSSHPISLGEKLELSDFPGADTLPAACNSLRSSGMPAFRLTVRSSSIQNVSVPLLRALLNSLHVQKGYIEGKNYAVTFTGVSEVDLGPGSFFWKWKIDTLHLHDVATVRFGPSGSGAPGAAKIQITGGQTTMELPPPTLESGNPQLLCIKGSTISLKVLVISFRSPPGLTIEDALACAISWATAHNATVERLGVANKAFASKPHKTAKCQRMVAKAAPDLLQKLHALAAHKEIGILADLRTAPNASPFFYLYAGPKEAIPWEVQISLSPDADSIARTVKLLKQHAPDSPSVRYAIALLRPSFLARVPKPWPATMTLLPCGCFKENAWNTAAYLVPVHISAPAYSCVHPTGYPVIKLARGRVTVSPVKHWAGAPSSVASSSRYHFGYMATMHTDNLVITVDLPRSYYSPSLFQCAAHIRTHLLSVVANLVHKAQQRSVNKDGDKDNSMAKADPKDDPTNPVAPSDPPGDTSTSTNCNDTANNRPLVLPKIHVLSSRSQTSSAPTDSCSNYLIRCVLAALKEKNVHVPHLTVGASEAPFSYTYFAPGPSVLLSLHAASQGTDTALSADTLTVYVETLTDLQYMHSAVAVGTLQTPGVLEVIPSGRIIFTVLSSNKQPPMVYAQADTSLPSLARWHLKELVLAGSHTLSSVLSNPNKPILCLKAFQKVTVRGTLECVHSAQTDSALCSLPKLLELAYVLQSAQLNYAPAKCIMLMKSPSLSAITTAISVFLQMPNLSSMNTVVFWTSDWESMFASLPSRYVAHPTVFVSGWAAEMQKSSLAFLLQQRVPFFLGSPSSPTQAAPPLFHPLHLTFKDEPPRSEYLYRCILVSTQVFTTHQKAVLALLKKHIDFNFQGLFENSAILNRQASIICRICQIPILPLSPTSEVQRHFTLVFMRCGGVFHKHCLKTQNERPICICSLLECSHMNDLLVGRIPAPKSRTQLPCLEEIGVAPAATTCAWIPVPVHPASSSARSE